MANEDQFNSFERMLSNDVKLLVDAVRMKQ